MSATAADDRTPGTRARWQRIEVRHLAALAAVAREGSFRRAADELGYVQSAISGQIAHLEQSVGVRLLDRASGTPVVELTSAGQVLLCHTDEILGRLEAAYADVSSLGRRTAGVVRAAGLEQFTPARLADILTLFRQRHPVARVVLEEPSPAAGLELLEAGSIDLLVCEDPPATESIDTFVVERDEYVLVVGAGTPLARQRRPVSAPQLASAHPIVPDGCARAERLQLRLAELGVAVDGIVAPDSPSTAQACVGGGLGTAILPSRLVRQKDDRVVALDLSHILPAREIVLATPAGRDQSLTVQSFVRDLCEVCDPCVSGAADGHLQAASAGRCAA